MREIKFRAWDKTSNLMRTDISSIDYSSKGEICQINVFSGVDILFPAQECALMQYTGLKDASGVGVYEGDVVCSMGGYEEADIVCECFKKVSFEDGKWIAGCDCEAIPLYEFDLNTVIGNIYENPELLEGKE